MKFNFLSESSTYRILKGYDLVESPAFTVMSTADEFKHPTKRIHELWQTDFTSFKILNWGWYYLSRYWMTFLGTSWPGSSLLR